MTPDLSTYDVLLANISGGKDSQAMLDVLVTAADRQGVPRSRIVAVFCDLGDDDEWEGTRELAAEHAASYGIRFEVVQREVTGDDGQRRPQSLLEHIEERGMWPDAARRYCTSDLKRAPVHRLLTRLADEIRDDWKATIEVAVTGRPWSSARMGLRRVRILNVMGLRAQESPKRALMAAFSNDERASNARRHVDEWLPIHGFTAEQVWARIGLAGTRPHPVYAQGMPRLSCRFCVLASKPALVRAAQLDPAGAERRAALEARMGHDFKQGLPMRQIIELAATTPPPAGQVDDWAA